MSTFTILARTAAIRLVSFALVAALPSCTNIKNDRQRTKTEGTLAGAATGALIGAGIGALVKGARGGLIGAAAGALAGGLAGAAYGNAVANKKAGLVRKEDAFDRRVALARRETGARRSYNARLRTVITERERQFATLQAHADAPGATVEQFEMRSFLVSKVSEVDREARSWQATIDAHKAALRQASGDPRAASLQAQVDELSGQRQELLHQRERLTAIRTKDTP